MKEFTIKYKVLLIVMAINPLAYTLSGLGLSIETRIIINSILLALQLFSLYLVIKYREEIFN